MKNSIRLLWLLAVVFCATCCATGVLRAQPPDAADSISGRILDAETQAPIADARIAVFHNGYTLLQETKAAADGKFVAAPLLDTHQRRAADNYLVLVRADGYQMTVLRIKAGATQTNKIGLVADNPRTLHIHDLQDQPIAGASVQLLSVYAPLVAGDETKRSEALAIGQLTDKIAPVSSDEKGLASMNGFSASNAGKLEIRAPGFASMEIEADKIRENTIRLSRETVIEGRMTYKDSGLPFYHPTPVAKVQSWQKYQLWRQSHIREDGTFEITDIPSLEMLGDKTLNINLELNIAETIPAIVGNGMTIRYAPSGYNAFVTLEAENDEQKKWYLCYFGVGETGVLYKEGERATYNFFLYPLARIRGRVLLLPDQKPARVSYHDPMSLYSEWNVLSDAEGNFEIFAPEGDMTLKFKSEDKIGELLLKDLKGHETREVELKFEEK